MWYAVAAPVAIDTVATVANSNLVAGAQTVFISDQVGYTFYRDNTPNNGRCVYSKTTDGGATWGTPVRVDGQSDCVKVVVWYDRWTPGNFGTAIHIVTMDTSDDDLWYNRLDTTSDTRLLTESPVNITTSAGFTGAVTEAANTYALTVATDGTLYAAVSDNSDTVIVSCASTCTVGTNWTEVGTPGTLPNATDHNLLLPLPGDDVLLINRDVGAGTLRSRVWSGSGWSGWSTIDSSVGFQSLFPVGMAATVNHDTDDIYLVYAADNNDYITADHDIRSAVFSSGAWSPTTNVSTNATGRGLLDVALALDANTGDVYALYTMRTTIGTDTSANVYYKVSTDAMATWGSEQGPLNSSSGNLYGPFSNLHSDERIHVAWFDPATNQRFGDTVADIGPDTIVQYLDTQVPALRVGTTNYLGGTLAISSISSRTLSAVTLTEVGTIDAATDITAAALYYDLDTSAPYNCASETFHNGAVQFSATSSDGFSAANGTLAFAGDTIAISPTQTVCLYVVLTTATTTPDVRTLAVRIADPVNDIVVSGIDVSPATPIAFGTTTIVNPVLTQTGYHWRNDDGTESGATSATAGNENTPLTQLPKSTPRRLRLQVSTEGSTSTLPVSLGLQYATAAPTCAAATTWAAVSTSSDDWQLADASLVSDATDTTNIATAGTGAITDANSVFLTPNAAFRDATTPIAPLILATTSFLEVEFAIAATPSANDGATYCFRLTDAAVPLQAYTTYPEVTLAADVGVSTAGALVGTIEIPATNVWLGGAFVVTERAASRTVTEVTITETGTIDASVGLSNVQLYYDLDTAAPFDCDGETYNGTETQFGATLGAGFSASSTATFTDAVAISTTTALCLYVVSDITASAQNANTINLQISNPSTELLVSSGSVSPSTPVILSGTTTLSGSVLTQTGYHWRRDDGSETAASSASGGVENSVVTELTIGEDVRLRLGVANTGATTSPSMTLQLEYAPKVTDCDLVSTWTPVDATDDDWNPNNSLFLTHGSSTTDIATSSGGVSNGNTSFITSNSAVRTTDATVPPLTFTPTEFTELEFSLRVGLGAAFNTTYCFRVTDAGVPLPQYDRYAEIQTAPKRDFRVQRGTTIIGTSTATIVAGIDYEAPASTSAAFIRITNTHHTGAGATSGGGIQRADDVTAYIQNPDNLLNSITFTRERSVANTTYINWEIVEFVGAIGSDNEVIVRDVGTVAFGTTDTVATGSPVSVSTAADVVVFITGVKNAIPNRNYYTNQVTAAWNTSTGAPVFTRSIADNAPIVVSYAVVEYTGVNWRVQRVEHAYTAAGVAETASITPVGSLNRAFIHTQKRMGADTTVAGLGQTVWLSSIGAVSFQLDGDAAMAVPHVGVAWVVENTQLGGGAMSVQRLNGVTTGGGTPSIVSVSLPSPLSTLHNSSVFAVSSAAGTDTSHPRPIAGALLASTTALQLWRSDSGSALTYRAEIVTWPVAQLVQRQSHYRWYAHNDLPTPTDSWPPGPIDLGENTSITRSDDPPGSGEVLRLRFGVRVVNANMPANFTAYQLEYAERVTTCTAVSSWSTVGDVASSTLWRGYAATGTTNGAALSGNPPTPGDLLLSVSTIAGRFVHENPSLGNPYVVPDGGVLEYDWHLEHNNADPSTTYCFRLVQADGTPLDEYVVYPEVRTAGFSPASSDWRWYADPEEVTPNLPLAGENVAPINTAVGDTIALRWAVIEEKGITGLDARFRLQYSESATFANPRDLIATTTCTLNSLWCFVEGGLGDGALIENAVLAISDTCVSGSGPGCGTQHTSGTFLTGHTHGADAIQEYSFTIQHAGARANRVYYFRLYDLLADEPVPLASGATYPSIQTESHALTFSLDGLPVGTTTAGLTVTATTTPTTITFGALPMETDIVAAQRLTVSTNATEGYQVFLFTPQPFLDQFGNEINSLAATNAAPVAWSVGCTATSSSCVGYHTTDPTLAGGSTRFAPLDSYAGLSPVLAEIMYSSIPTTETHDVVYRLYVGYEQLPGEYETSLVYIAVPVY
jgi:hypothetical protein